MSVGFENAYNEMSWNAYRRSQGLSGIIYKEFLLLIVTPLFHICTS